MVTRARRGAVLFLFLAWAGAGCGAEEPDPARLASAAEAHLEEFARFDAWARRAFAADTEIRDPGRFEETLFAPIRGNEGVVAVWARREGVDARAFAMGGIEELPPGVRWVPIRSGDLDGLRLGTARLTPRGRVGAPEAEVLLLARRRPSGPAAEIEVVVAYLSGPAARE